MGDCILLKVIGVTTYNGTSRSGRPYVLTTLELDYNDERFASKHLSQMLKSVIMHN